jgi:hypothetical protein
MNLSCFGLAFRHPQFALSFAFVTFAGSLDRESAVRGKRMTSCKPKTSFNRQNFLPFGKIIRLVEKIASMLQKSG